MTKRVLSSPTMPPPKRIKISSQPPASPPSVSTPPASTPPTITTLKPALKHTPRSNTRHVHFDEHTSPTTSPPRPPRPRKETLYVAYMPSGGHTVRQMEDCSSAAYGKAERCIVCLEGRSESEECRFRGIRVFGMRVKRRRVVLDMGRSYAFAGTAAGGNRVVQSLVEGSREEATSEQAEYALGFIATTYLDILRRENRHELTHCRRGGSIGDGNGDTLSDGGRPMVRVVSGLSTRGNCDICATGIFLGLYLCGCCGVRMCVSCWEEWDPVVGAVVGAEGGRTTTKYDLCSLNRIHRRASMIFMTHSVVGEVEALLERVEKRVQGGEVQAEVLAPPIPTLVLRDSLLAGILIPVPTTSAAEVSLAQFQELWRKGGVPLVLTGLMDKFQLKWTPAYFMDNYGDAECMVDDCQTGQTLATTIGDFFEIFSDPGDRSHKLTDWPQSADFKDLFQDFENALPFPEYTTKAGPLNLSSYFPPNSNRPNLGPKIHTAYPSPDFTPKPKGTDANPVMGTTSLHFAITDTVNICIYKAGGARAPRKMAETKLTKKVGAIWDIWPPESTDKVREYLKHNREDGEDIDDPINRQLYYLDEQDIRNLSLPTWGGVRSYRVFQQPGDAVLIPAGCPYQVRNRMSCINVTVDFVSPENVAVCRRLQEENRKLANLDGRRVDVLRLWDMLHLAYAGFERVLSREVKEGGDATMNEEDGSGSESESGRDAHAPKAPEGGDDDSELSDCEDNWNDDFLIEDNGDDSELSDCEDSWNDDLFIGTASTPNAESIESGATETTTTLDEGHITLVKSSPAKQYTLSGAEAANHDPHIDALDSLLVDTATEPEENGTGLTVRLWDFDDIDKIQIVQRKVRSRSFNTEITSRMHKGSGSGELYHPASEATTATPSHIYSLTIDKPSTESTENLVKNSVSTIKTTGRGIYLVRRKNLKRKRDVEG